MNNIFEIIAGLRQLSGNAQLEYLERNKSNTLRDILEYTYNPHKKFKIEEGKYNKSLIPIFELRDFTEADWVKYKEILDSLRKLKSARDEVAYEVKAFIESFKQAEVLRMILFKDLRINMGIKKFQKVWKGFCEEPQVQLANKWEGQFFMNGYYSRKLDGIRNYTLYGEPYSRSNKLQKQEPLKHIIQQLSELPNNEEYVFDGELIYLNPDGTEDFQKAVSLIRSDNRDVLCDNIYFIIFDVIKRDNFLNKQTSMQSFKEEYEFLKNYLEVREEGISWFKTKLPNILLIRQVTEDKADELRAYSNELKWEGLMYRDGDAPYDFKRSKSLLKIKAMQDIELKVIGVQEGTGRHSGRLGAFVVEYEGSTVKVGSGYSDELRDYYWKNQDTCIGKYAKVQYFEKTTNIEGKPSLRFPVFLCFRNPDNNEEFLKF